MDKHSPCSIKHVCEKNLEKAPYVCNGCGKRAALDEPDQEKTTLLAKHINSAKRDSLNGHRSFRLSQLLLDEQLL